MKKAGFFLFFMPLIERIDSDASMKEELIESSSPQSVPTIIFTIAKIALIILGTAATLSLGYQSYVVSTAIPDSIVCIFNANYFVGTLAALIGTVCSVIFVDVINKIGFT